MYIIPNNLANNLKELAPYKGSENCTDPKEYIIQYYKLGRPATFYKDGRPQCSPGRSRSFVDLYFLTKAVFTDLEFQDFVKLIFSLLYKDLGMYVDTFGISKTRLQLTCIYCPDVKKPVIRIAHEECILGLNTWYGPYGINNYRCRSTSDGNPTLEELFELAEIENLKYFEGKNFEKL